MSSIEKVIIVLESREDTPGVDQIVSVDTYDSNDKLINSDQSNCGDYFYSHQEAIDHYSSELSLSKDIISVEYQE